MREEITNIKNIHTLLQKYYESIEDIVKVRFIDVYDIVKKYLLDLNSAIKGIKFQVDQSDEDKFELYHLLNLSWILLQKVYQNISFVIDEDPDNTSKSESDSYLIKLKEMSAKYSKMVLNVHIYDSDFLESVSIQSEKYNYINKWFRKYTHSIPLYVFITTKLIDKHFKAGNKSDAKKILDTVELDKTFILKENLWSSSFLSYGLLPESQVFESVDEIKNYFFKSKAEDDTETVGEILFIRTLPANDHVSLYLPQKSWMVHIPLNNEQIKESKIVNIKPKKNKDNKLSFEIEVKDSSADKFICIEQLDSSTYRLVRYFHWYEMNKTGGWKYDPTKDPKNPAHIPWELRPENKEKAEQQKQERENRSKWKPKNDGPPRDRGPQKPPGLPYVPRERLQKLLNKSSNRPEAYNKILERKIIESNKITKTQLKLTEIRIGNDVINRIKINAIKLSATFFADVSKKYKRVYDITADDLAILSNRIAKSILTTLKLDIIDSHLYYIDDFQNIYTKEFIHISKTETKNAGLTLKIFNLIIDKVHNFLFKPDSKFIKFPAELSDLRSKI
jgi:hypothetical protein